jgi:ATP synthase protein I
MSLDDLKARIEAARRDAAGKAGAQDGQAPASGLGYAMRIGIEFVSAIGVASLLGWAFDQWLGTGPWGLIVMFFLGAAAGFLNVFRLATTGDPGPGWREAGENRESDGSGQDS